MPVERQTRERGAEDLWSAVAERSGDTALDSNSQSLTMLPTVSSQSAVAVRLPTDFAGALHSAVRRQNAELVSAARRPYGVRWQSEAATPL